MNLNRYLYNYFLILFSVIPLSIIIGPAVSIINILLIDLSFIVLVIYKKNYSFLKNKTIIYLLILYIYLIFNSFISIDYSEGIIRNLGFLRIIILFVAFNYFYNQKFFFEKMFKFWLTIISIVIFDVFIEYIYGKNLLGYGGLYGNRIVSFFKDEPIVGGFINGFYLMLIGYLSNKYLYKYKSIIFFISTIFIISIFLTGERSSSIKSLLGILTFYAFLKEHPLKQKIVFFISSIILVFILIINSQYLKMRYYGQIEESIRNNNNIYLMLYRSGIEVFKANKLLGVGNKNYRIEACGNNSKNQELKSKKLYICSTHPHQTYIEFLSEHGLVGSLIIFFILYKLIFSKILDTFRSKNNLQCGSLIYLLIVFVPLIPSGAFFSDYVLTIFAINLSIFYSSSEKLNIFNKSNSN